MEKHSSRRAAEAGATRTSNRSRSREREEQPPRRQLRSHTRTVAAIQAAYGDNPQSISRLHDDELVCVLSFLFLPDLSQLVRCSRRFNGVARKERSRGLELLTSAVTVPSLVSSTLGHHVTVLFLERRMDADLAVTRATLAQLRSLPQLTALSLQLHSNDDVAALVRGLPRETAMAVFQATLPPQLRAFEFSIRAVPLQSSAEAQLLLSAVLGALPVLTHLTTLCIRQVCLLPEMRLDVLSQLPHLRSLALNYVRWTDERLAELKQLSPLREFESIMSSEELFKFCQPPHSFQLEHFHLTGIAVDVPLMRALLHLPTLTALEHLHLLPEAWPLLPQLPLLRRLGLGLFNDLTAEHTSLLSASLSSCRALTELTLLHVSFVNGHGRESTDEQQQARWTELLRSVPHLQRFEVGARHASPLLAVLPLHLPQLATLSLHTLTSAEPLLAQFAHPTLQEVELTMVDGPLTDAQTQQLLHSPRLPQLTRCTCARS